MQNLSRRGLFKITAFLVTLLAFQTPSFAQSGGADFRAIEEELAGPVSILLKNGNRQTGQVASWNGETMRLEVQLGGGSAEMTFAAEDIEDVAFPGSDYLTVLTQWTKDPERSDDALALFRAFYKQRGGYLQFMDENELGLFVRYARYALEQNKPLRAVAMIEVLRPHIEDEALLKSLDDAILLGFFLGGMREEAEEQARKWVESADPAGSTALGWRILAEIYFLNEEFEDAFWTALYPVAFANQMPMEHLDACYAFAIAAAEETRQRDVQERLHLEMRSRELLWPENIPALVGLEPMLEEPADEALASEEGDESEATDTIELEPILTPSPLDPVESLPTRMPHISE